MSDDKCERCGHNFVSKYAGDDVCLICLTELEEDELYEAYLSNCAVKGIAALPFDVWCLQSEELQ